MAGLVVMLALLTVLIVRNTTQSEPPDLSPVEVTPEPTETSGPKNSEADADSSVEADSSGSASDSSAADGRASEGSESGDADSKDPQEIEHSYEPVPIPPREVPGGGDDDGDDGDDDGDDGDDGDDDDD